MWWVGTQETEPEEVVGEICCPPQVVDTGEDREMLPGAGGCLAARSLHCAARRGFVGASYPQTLSVIHRKRVVIHSCIAMVRVEGWPHPPDMVSAGTRMPGMGGVDTKGGLWRAT
jgi:hypothetical protein